MNRKEEKFTYMCKECGFLVKLKNEDDDFKRSVVCPRCNAVVRFDDKFKKYMKMELKDIAFKY